MRASETAWGTLFAGTNTDVIRASVWASSRVAEEWSCEPFGVLARRSAAHNGAPGFHPLLDRAFVFDQTLEAMSYVEQGKANGKFVITQ